MGVEFFMKVEPVTTAAAPDVIIMAPARLPWFPENLRRSCTILSTGFPCESLVNPRVWHCGQKLIVVIKMPDTCPVQCEAARSRTSHAYV